MKSTHYLLFAACIVGIANLFYIFNEPAQLDVYETEQAQALAKGHPQGASQGHPSPAPYFSVQRALPPRSFAEGVQPASSGTTEVSSTPVSAPSEPLAQLPGAEQKSLWKALSEARREVRPITDLRAEREENLGYDFYALHSKQHMTTRFGSQGVQIVSLDRTYTEEDAENPATTWQAQMRLLSFAGQDISQGAQPVKAESSSKVEFHHQPGLTEWYDNGVAGMEHGYTIAARPAHLRRGEQVSIEVALDGLQATVAEGDDDAQALLFMDGEREVLSYSKLLVVDADGRELPATMEPSADGFTLAYHDAQAVYPVTVDPLIINQEAKLNRIGAGEDDHFGHSVAISGDTAVIGTPGDDNGGADAGSAYVFERSGTTWTLQGRINAYDAAAGDNFGVSVSVSGDTVVVGADKSDGGGSAYVFVRSGSTWTQQTKLTGSNELEDYEFGHSVSISGDTVIVGTPAYRGGGGDYSGCAYIFVRSGIIPTWTQQARLIASDAAENDQFGTSVAISGDYAIIGSPYADSKGAAYVFSFSSKTWSQQAKLIADDGASGDRFGASVAIAGSAALVGAPYDDDDGANSGSAYYFARSGTSWHQTKITASDGAADNRFGHSVALEAGVLVVGAPNDDAVGRDHGSAYRFTYNFLSGGWLEGTKFTAAAARTDDYFGRSVAISGNSVIVGAEMSDEEGLSNAGNATVFVRNGGTWSSQATLNASYADDDIDEDDQFGDYVAISGDTVAIAGDRVYIFVRNGTIWSRQAAIGDAVGGGRYSVAISGDTVAVGYSLEDSNWNRAFIYERSGSTWTLQDELYSDGDFALIEDGFGYAVDISGDTLVVGAPSYIGPNYSASHFGSAYIFKRISGEWFQQARITASDGADLDRFGMSVAISGDRVVIGAPYDDDDGSSSGSAYIFERNADDWEEETKFTAPNSHSNDYFGLSVDIEGETIVVGEPGNDGYEGSAYVYAGSSGVWPMPAELQASDEAAHHLFGSSVAISGDTVAVGAPYNNEVGTDFGGAYLFTRSGTTWSQQNKLTASDQAVNDHFGHSVALSATTVVVGAEFDDDGGAGSDYDSGSVYIYRITLPATRELLVYSQLGVEIANGGSAADFPGQLLNTSQARNFRLSNGGELDLDIQSVTLGGVDAGYFDLSLPDISSTADIPSHENLYFVVSFNATGNSSGRDATITITSNDPDSSPFAFDIRGLGLSDTADLDSDGMTDWAEYSLRGLGFDWETKQTSLVDTYYGNAHLAGLYTQAQAGAVAGNMRVFNVDPVNNTVDLTFRLQESLDLDGFVPMIMDPTKLSIDADGNIRYQHETTADKKFFRAEWKGQEAQE